MTIHFRKSGGSNSVLTTVWHFYHVFFGFFSCVITKQHFFLNFYNVSFVLTAIFLLPCFPSILFLFSFLRHFFFVLLPFPYFKILLCVFAPDSLVSFHPRGFLCWTMFTYEFGYLLSLSVLSFCHLTASYDSSFGCLITWSELCWRSNKIK